jgi:hypothetical protein
MLTTTVRQTTPVVKARADDNGSHPCNAHVVSGLRQRIEWVVEHRAGGNQRELARMAGLAPSHIGTMLTRLRRDPDRDIESGTLSAIARGAKVSTRWLISGVGEPDDDADYPDPPSAEGTPGSPRFGSLHNWTGLRATAKALDPSLPEWALDEVENSHPLATAPITGAQVAKMARIAMELLPPPAEPPPRRRPTKAERLDAQLAEEKALFDKALKKGGVQPPPEGSAESHELQTRKGK